MFIVWAAQASTATQIINKKIGELTSSTELQALIKQLPPLTAKEKKRAKQFIQDARLQDNSCSEGDDASCSASSCYPNCMCQAGAAVCCGGQVCIGGDCDYGTCVGDPSKGNELASLTCGIKCL